jgi:hypothetical protein
MLEKVKCVAAYLVTQLSEASLYNGSVYGLKVVCTYATEIFT